MLLSSLSIQLCMLDYVAKVLLIFYCILFLFHICIIPVQIQGRGGSNVWQQDLVLLDLTQQTPKDASEQLWDGREPKKHQQKQIRGMSQQIWERTSLPTSSQVMMECKSRTDESNEAILSQSVYNRLIMQ